MTDVSISEIEDIVYRDVRLTQGSAPRFYIGGEEVDIWSAELSFYHTLTTVDYARRAITEAEKNGFCLLYTSPSPRDRQKSRMPSSA